MLCKNVGGIDRIVRAVIGLGALGAAFTILEAQKGQTWGIVAAVAGGVVLLTSVFGFCGAYVPFKMSTCKKP